MKSHRIGPIGLGNVLPLQSRQGVVCTGTVSAISVSSHQRQYPLGLHIIYKANEAMS